MIKYTSEIGAEEKQVIVFLSLKTVKMEMQRETIKKTCYGMFAAFMILMVLFGSFMIGMAGLVSLAFGLYGASVYQQWMLERKLDKTDFSEPVVYEITKEGLGDTSWKEITMWGEINHYIWIRKGEDEFILFDLNKMTDGEVLVLKSYMKGIKKDEKFIGKR